MAKHEITFKIPERQIMNSDAEFQVFGDDKKSGTLLISKGTISWKSYKKKNEISLSWEKFDRLMKEINENE